MNDKEPMLLGDFLELLIIHNRHNSAWGLQCVVEKPGGKEQSDLQFERIYVEQHQNGDDSFYGYVWYPLPHDKWLQTWFNT